MASHTIAPPLESSSGFQLAEQPPIKSDHHARSASPPAPEVVSTSHILRLPLEITDMIISNLDPPSLLEIIQVNKFFNQRYTSKSSESIWRSIANTCSDFPELEQRTILADEFEWEHAFSWRPASMIRMFRLIWGESCTMCGEYLPQPHPTVPDENLYLHLRERCCQTCRICNLGSCYEDLPDTEPWGDQHSALEDYVAIRAYGEEARGELFIKDQVQRINRALWLGDVERLRSLMNHSPGALFEDPIREYCLNLKEAFLEAEQDTIALEEFQYDCRDAELNSAREFYAQRIEDDGFAHEHLPNVTRLVGPHTMERWESIKYIVLKQAAIRENSETAYAANPKQLDMQDTYEDIAEVAGKSMLESVFWPSSDTFNQSIIVYGRWPGADDDPEEPISVELRYDLANYMDKYHLCRKLKCFLDMVDAFTTLSVEMDPQTQRLIPRAHLTLLKYADDCRRADIYHSAFLPQDADEDEDDKEWAALQVPFETLAPERIDYSSEDPASSDTICSEDGDNDEESSTGPHECEGDSEQERTDDEFPIANSQQHESRNVDFEGEEGSRTTADGRSDGAESEFEEDEQDYYHSDIYHEASLVPQIRISGGRITRIEDEFVRNDGGEAFQRKYKIVRSDNVVVEGAPGSEIEDDEITSAMKRGTWLASWDVGLKNRVWSYDQLDTYEDRQDRPYGHHANPPQLKFPTVARNIMASRVAILARFNLPITRKAWKDIKRRGKVFYCHGCTIFDKEKRGRPKLPFCGPEECYTWREINTHQMKHHNNMQKAEYVRQAGDEYALIRVRDDCELISGKKAKPRVRFFS